MRQGAMMCCLPCIPRYEVGLFGPSAQRVKEVQLAIHCQRVGHLSES